MIGNPEGFPDFFACRKKERIHENAFSDP